jgi:hypothetical protein
MSAFRELEPCAGKLARTALRGERDREVPDLPDVRQAWRAAPMTGAVNWKAKADQEVTWR